MAVDKRKAIFAWRLANIFTSFAPERLDAAFRNTNEIQQSKADKVVAKR
jgi:hypothetical protein